MKSAAVTADRPFALRADASDGFASSKRFTSSGRSSRIAVKSSSFVDDCATAAVANGARTESRIIVIMACLLKRHVALRRGLAHRHEGRRSLWYFRPIQ